MKYFTRKYFCGELSDQQFKSSNQLYCSHLSSLVKSATAGVKELAAISMHDGLLGYLRFDQRKELLHITVTVGDLQRGYTRVKIQFVGAQISKDSYLTLSEECHDKGKEILETEIHIGKNQRYIIMGIFENFKTFELCFEDVIIGAESLGENRSR